MKRENLKKKLKIYLIKRGFNNLKEVARDFGISFSFLSSVCNGKRNLGPKKAHDIIEKTKFLEKDAVLLEDIL